MQQPTLFPKYLDAYETAKLYNQAKVNDGLAPYFSDTDLELYKNGKDPYGHPNNNWREILFKNNSLQSRNNLDVSGGTDKVKYFLSTGFLWQNGMLRNFGASNDVNSDYYYKRYNYRSNLDIKVTKSTDLRLDLYGNVGETNSPYFESANGIKDIFWEYGSFLTLSPYAYPIYNPNGSFGYSTRQEGRYNVGNIVSRLTRGGYVRNFENNMNLVSTVNQKLDFITKGLSLKGTVSYASSYSYNRDMNRQTHSYPEFIYDAATNKYTPRDASVYRVRRFFLVYDPGQTARTVNLQAILSYNRSFGGHNFTGLALFNQRSDSRNNTTNNLYSYVPSNFRGYSGRVGYNYRQRYLFEFNAGYNGTDRFVSSKRFGFFPAASVGWNIAEEGFFKNNVHFVDNFKVRASYGLVGSDQLPTGFQYSYAQVYNNSGSASFGYADNTQGGITEGTLSNSEVTWEKEKKLDLGVDLILFGKKLTVTADYFNNNRYDILTTRGTVSAVFGQGLPPVNLGRVNNKGYEFEVVYRGNAGGGFSFNVRANYSFAKNKILFMDEPQAKYPWMQATGGSSGLYEGSAAAKGMLYRWVGFYTQADIDNPKVAKFASANKPGDLKYADLNNDGVLDAFDMEYTGYPNLPNTTVGLGGGINYKNFNFNFLFQGAYNFNVRGVAEAIQAFGSNMQPFHQQAWTPELGDNAKYPRLSLQPSTNDARTYPSTFWSVSGNYIRLRSAEIGYTLPASLIAKLKINAARVYVNGYNLFSWSKVQDRYQFDPELATGNDRAAYPPQRMINVGLTVTF
jgi:TonB-linked SusC/RagA family outer membrane protein